MPNKLASHGIRAREREREAVGCARVCVFSTYIAAGSSLKQNRKQTRRERKEKKEKEKERRRKERKRK